VEGLSSSKAHHCFFFILTLPHSHLDPTIFLHPIIANNQDQASHIPANKQIKTGDWKWFRPDKNIVFFSFLIGIFTKVIHYKVNLIFLDGVDDALIHHHHLIFKFSTVFIIFMEGKEGWYCSFGPVQLPPQRDVRKLWQWEASSMLLVLRFPSPNMTWLMSWSLWGPLYV